MRMILGVFTVVSFLVGTLAHAAVLPGEITVNLKYSHPSTPVILEDDDGSTIAVFTATIETTAMSFDPHDLLKLEAASSKEFVTPTLNGCQLLDYSFSYVGRFGSEILMFGGRDPKGSKACQTFMKSVARGFQMKFTNVPLSNAGSVVKSVSVRLEN